MFCKAELFVSQVLQGKHTGICQRVRSGQYSNNMITVIRNPGKVILGDSVCRCIFGLPYECKLTFLPKQKIFQMKVIIFHDMYVIIRISSLKIREKIQYRR